ncbi:hypothetical protein BDW74DRAFT_166118 [Aspergillus multicolor]|uniref:uncharacterized protein n=1 Tax=Aspergillus multicolor TaxID=41759 RepID=UPI003CCE386A
MRMHMLRGNTEDAGEATTKLATTMDSVSGPEPLSRVIARFIEPAPLSLSASPTTNSLAHWHTLRNMLYLLRFGSPNSSHYSIMFHSALDQTQKTTLALLEEWWTGRPELTDKVLERIKVHLFNYALPKSGFSASIQAAFDSRLAGLKALALESDLSFLHSMENMDAIVFEDSEEQVPETKAPVSETEEQVSKTGEEVLDFIDDMYHEPLMRLYLQELCPFSSSSELSQAREIAAAAALDKRFGYHAVLHSIFLMEIEARNGHTGPSTAFKVKKARLSEYPRPIPTILNPCNWLKEEQAQGVPFYLWNIKHRNTIKTGSIREKDIRYAIVSHTWGRYRNGDAMETVCGVPWRVPKISLFDVRQIPRMLLEVGTAVVWMSDVPSWERTEAALLWLGLKLIREKSTDLYPKLASLPCELAQVSTGADEDEDEEPEEAPPGWFTSLWTLQELMMRPDMIILDRAWRPLLFGSALAITVKNLIVLGSRFIGLEHAPKGTKTLLSILKDQPILGIGMDGPLVPLIVGAQRTSTSPRAPAIMSVIEATDWFKGRTLQQYQSAEEVSQLVLGLYPLDFVEEVRGLGQAAFFPCTNTIATLVRTDGDDPLSEYTPAPGYPLRGTMLPFMPVPEEAPHPGTSSPYPRLDGLSEHPTVRSWQIHLDGSVTFPKVVVLASNLRELQLSCPLEFVISSNGPTDISFPHRHLMRMPLDQWITEFDGEAYAESFFIDGRGGHFVKAGAFIPSSSRAVGRGPCLIDPESIAVLDVDWRVY